LLDEDNLDLMKYAGDAQDLLFAFGGDGVLPTTLAEDDASMWSRVQCVHDWEGATQIHKLAELREHYTDLVFDERWDKIVEQTNADLIQMED